MKHNFLMKEVTDTDVVFQCSVCGALLGFNKPGIGEPAAVSLGDGTWEAPADAHLYIGECQ